VDFRLLFSMNKFEKRLLINIEHDADLKFFSLATTLLARGYLRVVIGKRGPYVEFSTDQIIWDNFMVPKEEKYRLTNAVVYYNEYRSTDSSYVKLYHQKRLVAYADYKVGLCYMNPFDLMREDNQPVII
jgi:hypothetical protein